MARFCTKCGTPADPDARFCEGCGAPYAAAPSVETPELIASPPRRPGKRAALIGGGVLAAVVVVGGLVFLSADEQASPEVFAQAIDSYYAKNPTLAAKLLCVGDLQLGADPVEVSGYDGRRRALMDRLVSAGLYGAPETASTGGFLAMQVYRYSRTDAGQRAVQQGRLCVAPALQAKGVRFEQQQGAKRVVARFRYDFKQPEPWLQGDLANYAVGSLGQNAEHAAVMELHDRKWVMTSDDARSIALAAQGRGAVQEKTFMQRVQGWFRTGNPLLGKWRVVDVPMLAGTVIRFDAEQAAVGRPSEPVRYEVQGDTVTLHYVEREHTEVFNVVDNDHITLQVERDSIALERVKD